MQEPQRERQSGGPLGKFFVFLRVTFFASLLCAIVLRALGLGVLPVALPGLVIGGLAIGGHFVSINDDFEDGWSN
ncbi:MAG: hypothetical protein AAF690_27495, partial [Acidobacteriota bacterium]